MDEQLTLLLNKSLKGDRDARRHFFTHLAKSTVFVPASIRESDSIVRCKLSNVGDGDKFTIPVFTDKARLKSWRKQKRVPEGILAVMGADLCSSIDLSTQLIMNPDSGVELMISPDQIEVIACAHFAPLIDEGDLFSSDPALDIEFDENPPVKTRNSGYYAAEADKKALLDIDLVEEEALLEVKSRREEERQMRERPPMEKYDPYEPLIISDAPEITHKSAISVAETPRSTQFLSLEDEPLSTRKLSDMPLAASFNKMQESKIGNSALDPTSTQFIRPLKRSSGSEPLNERFTRPSRGATGRKRFGDTF
jgi:hypothetical protein